jgi:antitoxin component of MazEF toxin-antitoxin module
MIAEVKRWGNSMAIRLTKSDLREHGLKEGDVVKVSIERVVPEDRVDLRGVHTFQDDDGRASENHDRYLYGGSI